MNMHQLVGGMVMLTLAVGSYVVLHIIARMMEKRAAKEWLERNSSGPFDLDR